MTKLKYLSYILLGASAILFLYFFLTSGKMTPANYATNSDAGMYKTLDAFLGWAYILLGITALLAIVLPIVGIVRNPKNVKKIIINVGVLALVLVVSYLLASGTALPTSIADQPSAATWKLTDAALIATYIFLGAAFASIIFGGIVNIIRNR